MVSDPQSASFADLGALTLASIVHRCEQEMVRFFQRLRNDPRFCFELFRRAIQEQNQRAWGYVYEHFGPLVSGWVLRHPSFQNCGEEASYFVNRAFERFWSAVSPEKFDDYPSLSSLLKYFQLCVHSAIMDFLRRLDPAEYDLDDLHPEPHDPDSGAIEQKALRRIEREELWKEVEKRLNDEDERIVIHAGFVLGFKAREIQAQHPERFPDVKDVYLTRKNVLARLKRDLAFKALLRTSIFKSEDPES